VSTAESNVVPIRTPVSFFGEKGLEVVDLGQFIEDAERIRLGTDGRLYRYDAGVYRGDGEGHARAQVREILGDRWRKRHGEEVVAWLRAVPATITDRPDQRWINVRNGLLDWRTGELHPHDADVESTLQLPVPWNPEAACPLIDAFLAQVAPEDAVELITDLVGYTLLPANPLRRALLLLGRGRNGKSVLLSIIRALIGPANISTVPLQALAENRFAAAELYGKLANISGDLDARAVKSTDVLKMATGGDPITAERKYAAAFSFTPYCSFWFAANEPPVSSDQSQAWFDRWVVIPLDRRIPDERVDPHLTAKLTTAGELEGLLVRAVEGLRRIMDRGLLVPDSVEVAGARYRSRLDTVAGFLDEEAHTDPDAWVPRSDLYRRYRAWATDGGRLPVGAPTFNDHLRANLAQVEETTRNGIRGWRGLALNETSTL
jgi:P4 family phage/plasmid primase-like protien